MKGLLAATSLLTRIPVRLSDWSPPLLARSIVWFPAIGGAHGAVVGFVYVCAGAVLPHGVAAAASIGLGLLLTGALHEDGLADTADGLGGGRTASDALRIMRDSRIGVYGALAIGIMLSLRVSLMAGIPQALIVQSLMVAGAASRAGMVLPLAICSPARNDGLASVLCAEVRLTSALFAILCAGAAGGALGGVGGAAAAFAGIFVGWLFARWFVGRVGGVTGDGLGAVAIVSELVTLTLIAGGAGVSSGSA